MYLHNYMYIIGIDTDIEGACFPLGTVNIRERILLGAQKKDQDFDSLPYSVVEVCRVQGF